MNAYSIMLGRCGLSQPEAAGFHGVRLDTVKSWASGRRPPPAGAVDELRRLYGDIAALGHDLRQRIVVLHGGRKPHEAAIGVPLPHPLPLGGTALEHRPGAVAAAIGLAIATLPEGTEVLVEESREDGPVLLGAEPIGNVELRAAMPWQGRRILARG